MIRNIRKKLKGTNSNLLILSRDIEGFGVRPLMIFNDDNNQKSTPVFYAEVLLLLNPLYY